MCAVLLPDNQVENPVQILRRKITDFYLPAAPIAEDLDARPQGSFQFQ
jgi:hypothetical protein